MVGYVSRFARKCGPRSTPATTSTPEGRRILFCDERVLACDEDAWERWAREAVEAEAYSRRLGEADPGGLRREVPPARRPGWGKPRWASDARRRR